MDQIPLWVWYVNSPVEETLCSNSNCRTPGVKRHLRHMPQSVTVKYPQPTWTLLPTLTPTPKSSVVGSKIHNEKITSLNLLTHFFAQKSYDKSLAIKNFP